MGIWYTTRESVKQALDVKATARDNAQVAAAIEAASRAAEGHMRRVFYPWVGTRSFDYPGQPYTPSWRLWLDQYSLISLTGIANGDGSSITPANVFLNPIDGPPFDYIETNQGTSAAFASGSTNQRAITVSGVFGWSADDLQAATLVSGITASQTTFTVSDSSQIGVGSLLRIDTERVNVTEKSFINSGQTLLADMDVKAAAVSVLVTDGTAFRVGETIILNVERMLIVDIVGNTLSVKRAWDGSVLATHSGSNIFVDRSLTVVRAAGGTTAATHLSAAPVYAWLVPGGVAEYTLALAVRGLVYRTNGWTSADDAGLKQVERDAFSVYGRVRQGVV